MGLSRAMTEAPYLRGFGQLEAGMPMTIDLRRGPPDSWAPLIVGFSAINAPFLGGTLVPNPEIILTSFSTNEHGDSLWTLSTFPDGFPSGTEVYFQQFVADPDRTVWVCCVQCSNGHNALVTFVPFHSCKTTAVHWCSREGG